MPFKRNYASVDENLPTIDFVPAGKPPPSAEETVRDDSPEPSFDEPLSPDDGQQSTTLDEVDTETDLRPSGPSRKKSEPVRSACGQCQRRKTKCSGERPTCRFCSDRGLDCLWETGVGLTRTADLKQRLVEADSRSADINTLVHDMRTNTDAVATTLLAKLRLGASIEELARGIRADALLMQHQDATHTEPPPDQIPESTIEYHGYDVSGTLPFADPTNQFNWKPPGPGSQGL